LFHWLVRALEMKAHPTFRQLIVAALAILLWNDGSKASEDGVVELYEHWNTYTLDAPPDDMKPIIFQVPEAFRYGSSKGSTRNWGLNLLTFYPNFRSSAAPENIGFGSGCIGDCNGRMLVAINNSEHAVHHPNVTHGIDYPNMGDFIAAARLKNLAPKGLAITELGPQHGFDRGYEVQIPQYGAIVEKKNRYLFHLSEDHVHYDILAECQENKFAQTCSLHFSLKCNPAIYVQVVALSEKHLDELLDVVSKTDQFVTSMVRPPACQ
jgi:hypothetical protein